MNILVYSVAPWHKTGYGIQCGLLAKALKEQGHDVMIVAYRGLSGTSVMWEGVQVQPWTAHTKFSAEMLPYYYALHEADLCITLTDLFIFTEMKEQLAEQARLKDGMRFAHWIQVDAEPLGWPDVHILTASQGFPLAMTHHGERMLTAAGFKPFYFPHGVDTAIWTPLPAEAKAEVRKRLGIPQDAFVIGTDATNEDVSDRKGWSETLHAFAAFHQAHPDAILYAHTLRNRHPVGLDLETMCDRLGITEAVIFPEENLYKTGAITTEMLSLTYSAWDLYTGCSKAEGFGLPLAQAQACGLPVVTSRASAMPEVGKVGWRVAGQRSWTPLHASDWFTPFTREIKAAYKSAYAMSHDRPADWAELRDAARVHALQYDLKAVSGQHWRPVMAEVSRRLGAHDGDTEA